MENPGKRYVSSIRRQDAIRNLPPSRYQVIEETLAQALKSVPEPDRDFFETVYRNMLKENSDLTPEEVLKNTKAYFNHSRRSGTFKSILS